MGHPPALSTSAPLRYFTFAALYLAQGIPQGLFLFAIPAWLAAHDVGAATVGSFVGLVMLPWTFKLVVGPLMDRYGYLPMGRRRPWLLGAQSLLLLSMLALAFITDPLRQLPLLMALGFVISCFGAIQDVATDGLAVDITPVKEQARANALMWGSKTLGMSSTLALGTWAINTYGFPVAVLGISAVLLLVMIVPSLLRERPSEKLLPWSSGEVAPEVLHLRAETWSDILFTLRKGFLLRNSLLASVCFLFSGFVMGLKDAQTPLFTIQQLGWTNEGHANLVAVANLAGALAAMALAGVIADRFGKVRMITLYLVVMSLCWVALAASRSNWGNAAFITTMIWAIQTVETFCTVAVFATAMHLCWQRVAATQFTLYMVCNNVGVTLGGALLGPLRSIFDWSGMFLCCAGVLLVAAVLLQFLRLRVHSGQLDKLEQAFTERHARVIPDLGVPAALG